jgi:hypothetical protein
MTVTFLNDPVSFDCDVLNDAVSFDCDAFKLLAVKLSIALKHHTQI